MLIGAVADDLTGATDLALMLAAGGMRTIQVMGVPEDVGRLETFDAVVVALKSRTIPAPDAVSLSLAAARALRAAGCRQVIFKYCSTFDSTDDGNIGPVADALMAETGAEVTIACPAFPTNGRTIYMGNLFVGRQPLAESPMRDHPLTPMRDSDLVRVLQRQTASKVGLVPFPIVDKGAAAIRTAIAEAAERGERMLIVDAITDRDLREIGSAVSDLPLITGGSGIAIGLPQNFARAGLLEATPAPRKFPAPPGRAAILAGSCSQATRSQVSAAIAAGIPAYRITPAALADGRQSVEEMLAWAAGQDPARPVLLYSSDDPEAVRQVQAALGRAEAGELVERAIAAVGTGLVEAGVTRLIVAGGETSGAVVGALGVAMLEIGPEIDPGVPWTRALDGRDLVLALKSGNFGATDFFIKAWDRLA